MMTDRGQGDDGMVTIAWQKKAGRHRPTRPVIQVLLAR